MATATSNAEIAEEKANGATAAVGSGMKALAGTIRDHTPSEGVFHAASAPPTKSLETGGRYLQEKGLGGMGKDITNLVRHNPILAVFVGFAIGLVLAKITTSSFSHGH
jgi:hypothetical protein